MRKGYTGYLLSDDDRQKLAKNFKPKFDQFYGHHVTTQFDVTEDSVPPPAKSALIVGYATDGEIEVFVVNINGEIKREDGRTLHITWSLNPHTRQPKDSHKLLERGWNGISEPIAISLEPKFFEFSK